MGIRINTNIASINAQKNLLINSGALQRALERLSSGSRINKAGDDAAGLAVSEGLRSQVRGLGQAVRNANDGVGFLQTAEGALSESTNITQRVRELAIEAANGSISDNDRANLNNEVQSLIAQFDSIATTTEFNGVFLLDGSFTTTSLQTGIRAGDSVSFSIGDARSSQLGSQAVNSGAQNAISGAINGMILNGTAINPSTTDGVSNLNPTYSAIAIARAINAQSGVTKVNADVNTTAITMNNLDFSGFTSGTIGTSGNTNTFELNGVQLSGTGIGNTNAFINLVNTNSTQTGVQAKLVSGSTSSVILYAADGRNIDLNLGTYSGGTFSAGSNFIDVFANSNNYATNGGFFSTGFSAVGSGVISAGLSATFTISSGSAESYTGSIRLRSPDSISITGTYSAALGFSASNIAVTNATALSTVSVATQSKASSALSVLDVVLSQLTNLRASLGAVQNRLTSNVNSLLVTSENLSAAESQIKDTDVAEETANLTKAQILQQAGIAILGQANSSAQSALALLKF